MKKTTLVIIAFIATYICFAAPVDYFSAQKVAEFKAFAGNRTIQNFETIEKEGQILFYLAILEPKGYIVIAPATTIAPIVAYSFDNDFGAKNMSNPLFDILCADMSIRQNFVPQLDRKILAHNEAIWHKLLHGTVYTMLETAAIDEVGPFVDTQWNQGDPYNIYCPVDPTTENLCPVGCVATAFAQLVNYWEYPRSMMFDERNSYYSSATSPRIWIDATLASIPEIDYNASGNHPTADMIARISYACGVVLGMQYADEGSAANTSAIPMVLIGAWDYARAANIASSAYEVMRTNALDHLPTLLSFSGDEAGHCLVCDGYKMEDSIHYYHLNLGWGGVADGFYALPTEVPSGLTAHTSTVGNIVPNYVSKRPPINFASQQKRDLHIKLTWDAPTRITVPVRNYRIWRNGELLATTPARFFIDETVPTELTNYLYKIDAIYDDGVSPQESLSITSGITGGWERAFTNLQTYGVDLVACADSGCFGVGNYEFGGVIEPFLFRYDAGGNLVFHENLAISGKAYALAQAIDHGNMVVAFVQDNAPALAKIDSLGSVIWERTYPIPEGGKAVDVVATPTGYAIAAAITAEGISQAALILTNSDGVETETVVFGTNYIPEAICRATDGTFAIVGKWIVDPIPAVPPSKVFVQKFSAAAESLWTCIIGDTTRHTGCDIIAVDDGYVVAGERYSASINRFSNIYLAKISTSGTITWTKHYFDQGYVAFAITATADGFTGAGLRRRLPSMEPNWLIFGIDDDGDTTFTREFSKSGKDSVAAICTGLDGSVFVTGYTTEPLLSYPTVWTMKLGGFLPDKISETILSTPQSFETQIFPNPFNAALEIDAPAGANVYIYSLSGKLVWQKNAAPAAARVTEKYIWQPDNLGSGMYFIHIETPDGKVANKRAVFMK